MMPQRNKRIENPSSRPETQQPSPKDDPSMQSSSSSSSSASFPSIHPPGFRFVPTDVELIIEYLKPFSRENKKLWKNIPIHHVNIYESNPQQLSAEYEKGNLTEWFFLSERTKMNKHVKRQKRGDNGGYWHATAVAKKIKSGKSVVGYRTALAYYVGKQPNGAKTNWLMQEYWLESSPDNQTVDHAVCKIYLSPSGKKKKEEGAESLEKEVVQPHNVENQQPQPQPQFFPTPTLLASHQPQPLGISDYHQPQFWPAGLDSSQLQRHDIAYQETHQSQPFNTIDHHRSHQLQFWQPTLDSHQTQPHDIACHEPHQPQPLDTFQFQLPQFWPAPLGSHQSHCHDIQYQRPQPLDTIAYQHMLQWHFSPAPLDSDKPQPPHQPAYNFDENLIDSGESTNSG